MDTKTHAHTDAGQTFGALLRQYRRSAGLSQEALAERAGLTAQAISALERGVRQAPYRDTVRLLARALHLSLEQQATLESTITRHRTPASPRVAATSTTGRHNLPLQLTPLIGREQDVVAIVDLLARPAVRLLTLTGPGGVGKTRLALHLARQVLDRFADGAYLVPLAPLRDPGLLATAIAQNLAVQESSGQTLLQSVTAYLRDKTILLLLDNVEHLLPAAPVVADLLAACPRLVVLATSRASLRLRGEHVYPVPPLAVPLIPAPSNATHPAPPSQPQDLASVAAVALFVQRAQAVVPAFALDATTAPTVAEICRRLDGLPLAIELAAARLPLLSPHALLIRLEQRLPLLTGGARDLPERQQTLRATLAWSYDLLHPAARAVFRRLAVFAGGCTLAAAEAVCAAGEELATDVLDWLGVLVEQSLLQRVEGQLSAGAPAPTGAEEPRFEMMETVREYGLEQLAAHGDIEQTQMRHAAYYLAFAEEAERQLTGPGQVAWLARLAWEEDNLRAALGWSLERTAAAAERRGESGLRLAGALWRFWYTRGNWSEGRRWLEQALASNRSNDSDSVAATIRTRALLGVGVLALEQGELAQAVTRTQEGLDLYQKLGNNRGVSHALNVLANAAKYEGNYARSTTLHQENLTLAREIGDRRLIAVALNNLGIIAMEQGDYVRAVACHDESLAIKRMLGDRGGIALSLINLGDAARHQGNHAWAAALFEESLVLARELGDERDIAVVLNNLGDVAREGGEYARARMLYEESLALYRKLGHPHTVAIVLANLK